MPPNCGRITQVHLIFNTSASCYMPHATLKTTAAVAASTNDAALSCVCVRLCILVDNEGNWSPLPPDAAFAATPCCQRIVAIKMQGNYFKKHLLRLSTGCGNAALHFRLQCPPFPPSPYLSLSLLWLFLRHSLCQSHWLSSHIRLAFVRAYCSSPSLPLSPPPLSFPSCLAF